MSALAFIATVGVVGLLAYLVVALLNPERFS